MNSLFRYATLVAAGCVVISLAAWMTTQSARTAAHQKVLITFEGPWAFATDPEDAKSIFAFAPKTAAHGDLVVMTERVSKTIPAGIYEVQLHAVPVSRSSTAVDPSILQARIDRQGVQHALQERLRYAIRLPRPEAYVADSTGPMRAGTNYPPGPSLRKSTP